jgi:hypothetical protein
VGLGPVVERRRWAARAFAMQGRQPDRSLITSLMFGVLVCAGDLLAGLDVSKDEKVLPTTYGRLQPPLGIHRLKVRARPVSRMGKVGGDSGGIERCRVMARVDWVVIVVRHGADVVRMWADCGVHRGSSEGKQ